MTVTLHGFGCPRREHSRRSGRCQNDTGQYEAGWTVDLGGPQLTAGPFLLDPECLGLLAESTAANIPPRSLMDEMGWIDFDDDRGKKLASKVETNSALQRGRRPSFDGIGSPFVVWDVLAWRMYRSPGTDRPSICWKEINREPAARRCG
jgi:hypothetical protein